MSNESKGNEGGTGTGTREEAPAALFFDVDGTLLWTDFDNLPEGGDFNDILPSPKVYEAFDELNRRGHLTFLCTGRPLSLVDRRLLDLGFTGCISGAGSCVSFGDEIVYESVIDPDDRVDDVGQSGGISRYPGGAQCGGDRASGTRTALLQDHPADRYA